MRKTISKPKWVLWAVLAIFILAMGLRINAPRADLPSHITFSGSILTDEGNQAHNSRSKALYDEWFPDDWRITNYNPILPVIKLGLFKLFGVGLWQLRLTNTLFAFLTLLFFHLTLRSLFQPKPGFAILGTLLMGTNFLSLMYNRIATFETSLIFWVVLCFWFMEKYRVSRRAVFILAATASAFMGFIFKSLMAYLIPVPFVAYLLYTLFSDSKNTDEAPFGRRWYRVLGLGVLGVILVALPWYFLHYLPNRDWILGAPGQYMSGLLFPRDAATALNNFLTFNWKDQFHKMPLIWLSAILYLPIFFRRLFSRRASLTETAVLTYFFAHTFMFFFVTYRPTRYLVPVIPAMIFMTILLLRHLTLPAEPRHDAPQRVRPAALWLLDSLWLTAALSFCILPLIARYITPVPLLQPSRGLLAASAILTALSHLSLRLWRSTSLRFTMRNLALPALLLVSGLSLTADAVYYLDWNAHKTYTVLDMSLEMKKKLKNAYICGMTSSVAVMENRHKTLWLYPGFTNWSPDVLDRYAITHALLGNDLSREVSHYFSQWPQRMEHAALLKTYHIKNYFLHFYDLKSPLITAAAWTGPGLVQLRVRNPQNFPVSSRIDLTRLEPHATPQHHLGVSTYLLPPGETTLDLALEALPSGSTVHFSLTCNRDYNDQRPLRYEGEIFSSRCGRDRYQKDASNGRLRTWTGGKDPAGFLAYGPAVPFGPGIFLVGYKLGFDRIQSRTEGLARLDIYAQEDGQSLAQRVVLARDTKKTPDGIYTIACVIRESRTLEFRLEALGRSDIDFDYADVTYLQGLFLDAPAGRLEGDAHQQPQP